MIIFYQITLFALFIVDVICVGVVGGDDFCGVVHLREIYQLGRWKGSDVSGLSGFICIMSWVGRYLLANAPGQEYPSHQRLQRNSTGESGRGMEMQDKQGDVVELGAD